MHTITYRPRGVCSRNMEIDVEGDVIQSVSRAFVPCSRG